MRPYHVYELFVKFFSLSATKKLEKPMPLFLRPNRHYIRLFCLLITLAFGAPHAILKAQTAAATTAPAAPPQQTAPAPRRSLPPVRYIPSHDYDMRDITLNLRFDWEREQALGTARITFAPLVTNLQRIDLDAANMTFNSVRLASGAVLKYESDPARERLRVMLDRAYQPSDVVTIVVDYHTNGAVAERGIDGFGRGLTFIKPTPGDPKRPRQIWSQGESEFNHYWFPCYDHPNDFATSEIIATVAKPFTVISNGKLLSTKDNADGTRTFDWRIDVPHASYLTSIVVGEYAPIEASYDGVPLTTYVYPNETEEGKVTAARLPDMVKFFSEKTGVKYPYAKYAETMTRDFGGGMENISATTLTDTTVHDARAELDQPSDSLISHELAHQWFGDYVACRTWADIWLNESFATYFQAMYDEHNLGRDDFLFQDVNENQEQYLTAWKNGLRRPVVTKNYRDPDAVFDVYAYPRGGAVLHMLRTQLGDDNWWRAINHYLTKYAHQPVSTEQFRIAIEEATGQSMDRFFDQWVYKMGHPIFRVTQSYDPAAKSLKLTVKQEQKIDPNSDYPQVEWFETPIDVEIGAAATGASTTAPTTVVKRILIEPKAEQTFTFPLDAQPVLVNFDYGSTVIKELRFDKATPELVYQLKWDTDVLGRTWALDRLSERLKDKTTSEAEKQQIAQAFSESLTNDRFWGVRREVATALTGVPPTDAVRASLIAATKDRDARVRARAITALASAKDATLASLYQGLLNDPSYAVVRAAAIALGQTKSPNVYDALAKLLATTSWRNNLRASGLSGLAALGDKRALADALRYAAPDSSVPVRAAAINVLGAVGKDDQRAFPLISGAFTEALASGNFQLGVAAAEALVALGDQRGIQVFEDARKKMNAPEIQFFLMQFEQRLRQNTQTVAPRPVSQ